jgi:hypothetical protein
MLYSDEDVDDALGRIAADVARRAGHPDFPAAAMTSLLDELRRMEAARRAGDSAGAASIAADARGALEKYRPTNSTSRSKALIAEVLIEVLGPERPPA